MAIAPCPHRPPCPGCPRYGAPGPPPAALARLEQLAAAHGLAAPAVVLGEPFGYRVRARLMVRGRPASPKVGLFQEGSHRLVDVPRCAVHHPLVNEAAEAARQAIRATGTRPYAERPHAGDLRALQVVVERPTQTAQVVLVGNAATSAPLRPLGTALEERLGARLHSLFWNGNAARTNVILGPHWERWRGPEAVRERIGGADVFFPPGAFGQSHLDLADRLVDAVQAQVPDGARVLELYAGCGSIGLGLLARSAQVTFVESAPDAVRGLELGLAARPAAERARAEVVAGTAGDAAERVAGADVVAADPPRKGLDAPLLAALAAAPPALFLYVSCDLDSFEAQCAALVGGGRLRLAGLAVYDLFPNTQHVETVARFEAR
ncbi:MAG TPA: RsmD family RNA methyltransferase [Myxococcota bacterium]|nr:RsmD family RNA methyltransferase [Myxococcota bacterium]